MYFAYHWRNWKPCVIFENFLLTNRGCSEIINLICKMFTRVQKLNICLSEIKETKHNINDCLLDTPHTPAFLQSACLLSGLQRGVVLSQANISRSGPLVQVVPHWNLGVIIDYLCGHISRKSFTGMFFILNFCLCHMLSEKITQPVFLVNAKIKFWLNCRIPCHPMALHVIEYK